MTSQRSSGSSSTAWRRIISAPAWVVAFRSALVIHDEDGTRSRFSTPLGRTAFSNGAPFSKTSYRARASTVPSQVLALACGSRSITSTRRPRSARAAPRFTTVVVLPTPPFWLATATRRMCTTCREAFSWRKGTTRTRPDPGYPRNPPDGYDRSVSARDDQVPERRRRRAVAAQAFEPTGLADSERLRRAATVPPLALAHSVSAITGSRRLRPSGVSEYSTLGGTSG